MSDSSVEAAIRYAGLGLRVVPVTRNQKVPAIEGWPGAATADSEVIREWFEGSYRDCGVGIVTGAESGCFVLDVDPRHGGEESLLGLVAGRDPLPDTVECLTGGGGRHLYFRWPEGVDIRNATQVAGLPGLDIRGEGGFVVAPPSTHQSGKRYEWEVSSAMGEVEMAAAPVRLLELTQSLSRNGDGGRVTAPERRHSTIPIGSRNATLTSIAGRLRADGFDGEEIAPLLVEVSQRRCEGVDDPSSPFTVREVERIAHGMDRYEPGREIKPADSRGWLADASARSLGEIMADEKPTPPPSILGDGLLPERSLATFFGPSNVGKTFFTMGLALAVAAGRDFLGWKTTACNVVYVCPELDLHEFWNRVEAIEEEECFLQGVNPDAPSIREQLERARLRIYPVTGDMLPRFPDLTKAEDREALIAASRARNAQLLLLDPLALLHSASENSNEEMLEVLRGLHEIKVRADTTPFVVHHPRKSKQSEKDIGFDAMRGAGAIAAHSRVILRLGQVRGKLRLTCEKATHTRRPEPVWLERLDSGVLVKASEPPDPAAEKHSRSEAVIRFIREQDGRPVDLDRIRGGVPEVAGLHDRTIRKYLNEESSATDHDPRITVSGSTRDRRWKAR